MCSIVMQYSNSVMWRTSTRLIAVFPDLTVFSPGEYSVCARQGITAPYLQAGRFRIGMLSSVVCI